MMFMFECFSHIYTFIAHKSTEQNSQKKGKVTIATVHTLT